jgi:hypothetical protein
MTKERLLLPIHRRPGALANIALAVCGISTTFTPGNGAPKIQIVWDDMEVNSAHLKDFGKICGLSPPTEVLYPLYPLTLAFPLIMRILGHKKAPLSVFRTLNTKLQVVSHREIGVHEKLRLVCETGALRIVAKGLEMDISSTVQAGNEIVWESLHTFYYRGQFGKPDVSGVDHEKLSAISRCNMWASWYLSGGIGLRFAGISGDTNGLHYSNWYARMLGFDKAFAQPILVLTKTLHCLPGPVAPNFGLQALFRGPIYYSSYVNLKGISDDTGVRFDIFCRPNSRPSVCCHFEHL